MEQHTELELERMQQMLLSTHFTLGEFLRSGTAIKYGIDNTPQDAIIIIRLMMLCEQVLEPLRKNFGVITVTSGYRCPQLNLAVHGVPGSQHTLGEAADLFIPNDEILKKYSGFIEEHCHFDQMILEPRGASPGTQRWLHVSYTMRRKNRYQILMIQDKKGDTMKKETWKTVIQIVISVLTAIATSLGVSSCMS